VVAMSRAAELSGRRHRPGRWYATLATIGTSAAAAFLGGPPEQAAGGAAAAPVDWGPMTTVARPRSSADFPFPPGQHMDTAVGPNGQGVVVFCDASKRLRATRLTRSGRWNTPLTVGPCNGQPAPSVALDSWGRATAVWISGLEVWSASQPAGGPWSRARVISPPTPDPSEDVVVGVFGVDLAVSPQGAAAAAWRVDTMDDPALPSPAQVVTRPAGGPWGRARTLDPDTHGNDYPPQVAVRRDGDVLAVYDDVPGDGQPRQLVARERVVGQDWGPASVVTTATRAGLVWAWDVAVGGGSTVAVWADVTGAQTLARRTAAGGWTSTSRLASATAADLREPVMVVDGAGTATIAWLQEDAMWTRTVDADGTAGRATRVGGGRGIPSLDGNGAGDLVLAWRGRAGDIRAADRPSGGVWGVPVSLGPGVSVKTSLRPNGDALAVWQRGPRRLVSSQARRP
jgi:hypothetical protein